jgi:hypothetical protein
MVTRRTGLLVTVVAVLCVSRIGPAQGSGASPMACASTAAPNMTPFDTAKVAALAGKFEIVMVDTTSLRGSGRQHAGTLTLWLQDSVPRRQATMARRAHEQFVVGIFEAAAPDSGDMWDRMTSRAADSPGVFWSDGFLRLGEFGPKSGISLYVRSTEPGQFRGMWTSHAGTAVIVDFTGEREPDEAGYFCARRVK